MTQSEKPSKRLEVLEERQKTHGDYALHAAITQNLKKCFKMPYGVRKDCVLTTWDNLTVRQVETLEMIAHKIGRILAGNPNTKDHWADIAGYATLAAEECDEHN